MLYFPYKRLYILIGSPRSGKDVIAKFLQESRNFEAFAFADKVKEEFGISKEDFEAAKISGDIEELRRKLWEFSEEKRAENPLYFVNKVLDDVAQAQNSVVITDVRTPTEYNQALYGKHDICNNFSIREAFWVIKGNIENQFIKEQLKDSHLSRKFLEQPNGKIYKIHNKYNALHKFIGDLEAFFLTEDIIQLNKKSYDRDAIAEYANNFVVREK